VKYFTLNETSILLFVWASAMDVNTRRRERETMSPGKPKEKMKRVAAPAMLEDAAGWVMYRTTGMLLPF
jgi:hypothetical protein